MKFLLINPPWMLPRGHEKKLVVPYPLGISYVAAFLEKNGIEVKILDVLAEDFDNKIILPNGFIRFGLSEKKILDYVKDFRPNVIGIGCLFTSQSEAMHNLAKLLKNNFPNTPIVVGGIHASSCPVETMSDKNIDFIVRGEGEITMLELVGALEHRSNTQRVKGVYYRKNNEIKYTGNRPLNMKLDSFPHPAYHLLNMEKYFEAGKGGKGSRRTIRNEKWVSMITSRGCPYSCFFCSIRNIYGRVWRPRSPENVLDEIEMLVKDYSITHFLFEDDNLTLDVERAKKIFKGIIEKGLKITWEVPNGIRADKIDEETVKLMKKSGCVSLYMGIECGDQDFLLNVVKKDLNLQDVVKATKLIIKYGIALSGFFILGMPGETKETMNKTISFARKLAKMGLYPDFNTATPLPSTEMYEIAQRKGLLVGNIESVDILLKPLIKVDGYTQNQITQLRRKAKYLSILNMLFFNPIAFLRRKDMRDEINPINAIRKLFAVRRTFNS